MAYVTPQLRATEHSLSIRRLEQCLSNTSAARARDVGRYSATYFARFWNSGSNDRVARVSIEDLRA